MNRKKFWPLDYDLEEELYELASWDLPGRRPRPKSPRGLGLYFSLIL